MNRDIIAYYDQLAPAYDEDRFGNSYGRFVDAGERRALERWLHGRRDVLEIACGTGRFSNLATAACDASQESLKVARRRHPSLPLICADAARLPFAPACFDAVFGFHLLMHLDEANVDATFAEASRVLKPGGVLVIDVLAALRRRLRPRRKVALAWHGRTAMGVSAFRALGSKHGLRLVHLTGLMLLPVQRLPHWLRPHVAGVDRVLSAAMPSLSSSLIGCFVKA